VNEKKAKKKSPPLTRRHHTPEGAWVCWLAGGIKKNQPTVLFFKVGLERRGVLLSRAAHWGTAGTREGWVAREGPTGARYTLAWARRGVRQWQTHKGVGKRWLTTPPTPRLVAKLPPPPVGFPCPISTPPSPLSSRAPVPYPQLGPRTPHHLLSPHQPPTVSSPHPARSVCLGSGTCKGPV